MRRVVLYFLFIFTCALLASAPVMTVNAEKPSLKGTDLVCNGESFFDASNIRDELTRLARADGVLPNNEKFGQVAVSGAPIASIVNQYKNCNPKPTYLVSDGAGIDLMQSGDMTKLGNTLKQYIEEMKKGGTKCLLWMIYPDPQGGTWANLKNNQDKWAVEVPKIMKDVVGLKVLLVDLRDTWEGHYNQYTSDGIHCTAAGGTATAEAFWAAMKADDWAFFDTGAVDTTGKVSTMESHNGTILSSMVNTSLSNGRIAVSFTLEQPSVVSIQLTTVSGRTVLNAQRTVTGHGPQTAEFNHGVLSSGIYCCQVSVGNLKSRSTLLVP